MDAIFDLANDLIMRLIGGTLSDGVTTVPGLLEPITTAVINNAVLVIPLAIFVVIILFGMIGGLFKFAGRMGK